MEKKDIEGYEGIYYITDESKVFSYDRTIKGRWGTDVFIAGKEIKQTKSSVGYFVVSLCKKGTVKQFAIHRLAGQAFIKNPKNKPQINHKNGIKTDNRLENLEWVTIKENIRHSWEKGLSIKRIGEKSPSSKFKNKEIVEIKKLIKNATPLKIIAKIFNTSPSNISHIKRGKTWTHIKLK